jgi:hypothetical protein
MMVFEQRRNDRRKYLRIKLLLILNPLHSHSLKGELILIFHDKKDKVAINCRFHLVFIFFREYTLKNNSVPIQWVLNSW